MKAGKFDLRLYDVEGWKLLVPESYINATPEEIEAKTGGCGPGSIGDWFVPDTMYGESVFFACQVHDWMYGEGESEEDKKISDRAFLWNMTILIQESPGGGTEKDRLDLIRLRRVMTYYESVYYGGGDAFSHGKTPGITEV